MGLTSTGLYPQSAAAVYGGQDATGSELVVGIMDSRDARSPGCSGALISERVVLTAAHCLAKQGRFPGKLSRERWDYWVTLPGVDTKVDDFNTRVQSAYIVITDDYTNSYDPKSNDLATQKDDIGFIILSKPIKISSYPRIASELEVRAMKANRALITHYGYGFSDLGVQTGKANKVQLSVRPSPPSNRINDFVLEDHSIVTDETGSKALCGGDSGGPWYAEVNGELLIVANTVAASGCRGPGSGFGGTLGTLVHKYQGLLKQKYDQFLANEAAIVAENVRAQTAQANRAPEAMKAGRYYQEKTACHGRGIVAVLQSFSASAWVDVAGVEGWVTLSATCYQPWTVYRATKGELLRWRLASPGAWEVFSPPFPETTSATEEAIEAAARLAAEADAKRKAEEEARRVAEEDAKKAAAEAAAKALEDARVKAAAEAAAKALEDEAKALAEAKAAAAAAAAAAAKPKSIICRKGTETRRVTSPSPKCPPGFRVQVTITCQKGTVIRKVSGINPRCPSGFKRR